MLDLATALCLMFAFTAANHLGLVSTVEGMIGHSLPVINCPMCSSFWSVLIYLCWATHDIIGAVAMSFFFAYLALWTELAMCVVDYFYQKIYEKVVSKSATDKIAPGANDGATPGAMSKLRKE